MVARFTICFPKMENLQIQSDKYFLVLWEKRRNIFSGKVICIGARGTAGKEPCFWAHFWSSQEAGQQLYHHKHQKKRRCLTPVLLAYRLFSSGSPMSREFFINWDCYKQVCSSHISNTNFKEQAWLIPNARDSQTFRLNERLKPHNLIIQEER